MVEVSDFRSPEPGSKLAEFESLVAPLELETGERLKGYGRRACLAAYAASPEGFADCCDRALRRGTENAVGLLVRMVLDEDHLLGPPSGMCGHRSCRDSDRCRYA